MYKIMPLSLKKKLLGHLVQEHNREQGSVELFKYTSLKKQLMDKVIGGTQWSFK